MFKKKAVVTFVLILAQLDVGLGVEEAAPEAFLQPRNFNPHPYEIHYTNQRVPYPNQQPFYINANEIVSRQNTGPVLFPTTPEDNPVTPQPNPYAVPISTDHPVNRHPYPVVVKKKKFRLGFYQNEEPVNPQVFKALAVHGAKVLRVPQAKDLKDVHFDPSYADQKKNYAFSYKVVDSFTGDDFSHRQSHNNQATNGEYRVKLPDGRIQVVSYTADSNGYKADVKYEDEKIADNYITQQVTTPTPPRQYVQLHPYPIIEEQQQRKIFRPVHVSDDYGHVYVEYKK